MSCERRSYFLSLPRLRRYGLSDGLDKRIYVHFVYVKMVSSAGKKEDFSIIHFCFAAPDARYGIPGCSRLVWCCSLTVVTQEEDIPIPLYEQRVIRNYLLPTPNRPAILRH